MGEGKGNSYKMKSRIWIGVLLLLLSCGWGRKEPSLQIIREVNKNDKVFLSTWEYCYLPPGGRKEKVLGVIDLKVEKDKFRIHAQWRKGALREGEEEWIYDGKILYKMDRRDKLLYWRSIKRWRTLLFWKIPPRLSPFGIPKKEGESIWQGREVWILKIEGEYEMAPVRLTYWVDREKKILVKKEHIIGPFKEPLWKETYRIKTLKFPSTLPPETFQVTLPIGYVKIKKLLLDSPLVDAKF